MLSKVSTKLATDLFAIQFKWSLWFLGIVLSIHVIVMRFVPDVAERELNFLAFVYQPSKIFMLVIGIITVLAFLTYFVRQGIIRKDIVSATVMAAFGLAFVMIIISALTTGILLLISNFIPFPQDTGASIFLHTQSEWIVPIIAFSLIIFSYYLAGMLIGIGFYRFGVWGGLGYIAISIVFMSLTDLLWEFEVAHQFFNWLNLGDMELPLTVSFIGSIILLGFSLWIIRATTKRVRIKME